MPVWAHAHTHAHAHWPLCSLIKKLHHPTHIYHPVIRELRPSTSSIPRGEAPQQSAPCLSHIHHTWLALGGSYTTHTITQYDTKCLDMTHTPIPKLPLHKLHHNPLYYKYFVRFYCDFWPFFFQSRCRHNHSQRPPWHKMADRHCRLKLKTDGGHMQTERDDNAG